MGQPAARVGDMHVCPMFDGPKPHVGGPVLPPGKLTVLIGGMPAATITDLCACASAPDVIMQGAQTVLINGLMAARMGDATVHGGRIVIGCPTVLIGGPTFTNNSLFNSQSTEPETKKTIGEAGFWEGLIPVWGSLRDSIHYFQSGALGLGLLFLVMAIFDAVTLPADIASFGGTAALKAGIKALIRNLVKKGAKEIVEKAAEQGTRQVTEEAVQATVKSIPDKAKETLKHIKREGRAPDGYVGGRRFRNRESKLPNTDSNGQPVTYQEWDVNPHVPGQNRGTERIVTGSDGRSWYTDDHYGSFTEIK